MQNAPIEHSAILSTFIKLTFVFKTFVLSVFEWPLRTGFTVLSSCDTCTCNNVSHFSIDMKAKNFLSTPVLSVFEVLTLFVCSWSLHGHACDIDASFIVLYGSYLSGFNFWSLNVSDIGACARACMRMTLCLSFNVDLHAGACDLNSDLLENWSGSQIKQRSRVYSRKKDWPREVSVIHARTTHFGTYVSFNMFFFGRVILTLCLLVSSADNPCKQYAPLHVSSPTKVVLWLGTG